MIHSPNIRLEFIDNLHKERIFVNHFLYFFSRVKYSGMVAIAERPSNVRRGQIGHNTREIHGYLTRHGDGGRALVPFHILHFQGVFMSDDALEGFHAHGGGCFMGQGILKDFFCSSYGINQIAFP